MEETKKSEKMAGEGQRNGVKMRWTADTAPPHTPPQSPAYVQIPVE